jgi:L-amino acid N-acyltransferase YncA
LPNATNQCTIGFRRLANGESRIIVAMKTCWAIREATAAHAEAIARLVRQFNLEQGNPPGRLAAAEIRDLAFGPKPRFQVLVADDRGEVIGYTLYFPSYSTEDAAKGFYVEDLYVVPEARGRGVGRALMAAVARACEADGGRCLYWNVRPDNHAGRAFYRAIGARDERLVTLSFDPDQLHRLAEDA